jgi:hypothetical protein
MPDEAIDYEALAKKHGGVAVKPATVPEAIDYEEIAKKHGGVLVTPLGYTGPKPNAAGAPTFYEDIGTHLVSALPYAGGTVGGLLGGAPGAAIGAGIGSAAERGLRRLAAEPAPEGNVAQDILEKGLIPEVGGAILNKTLGFVFRGLRSTRLYASALRPSGTPEAAAEAVQTGIREAIVPGETAAGVARSRINALNSQIENLVSRTPTDIPPAQYVSRVGQKLDALRTTWGKDATHGRAFVDQIDELERQFLMNHGNVPSARYTTAKGPVTIQPADMTLAELRARAQPLAGADAQAIKKATYETIRTARSSAWESGVHPGMAIRANQEIARALKEELQLAFPTLRALNAREGALIGLEEQLQRFTKNQMNTRIYPYFVFTGAGAAFGAAAGAAGGTAGAAGGAGVGAIAAHLLRSALEDPATKARLAIALDRASRLPGARLLGTIAREIPATGVRGVELMTEPPIESERAKQ